MALPPGAAADLSVFTAATDKVTTAQKEQQRAGSAAREELDRISTTSRTAAQETARLGRSIDRAETSVGRYSRGMIAATAASTGFFRAVAFASGAFLVGAAIGATIGAAAEEFVQMTQVGAQTTAILRSTGQAARVTAEDIDALAQSQLELTGIDDELTKASANVILTFRGIRNAGEGLDAVFDRAVRAATDISTVLGTNLRSSSIQVGKALQDPVRGVTALRRAGVTLSQSQRDLIKDLAESGQLLRAQKIILSEIERQVGGTAAAVGQTLPGQFRRMREESVNALADLVTRVTQSREAAELAAHGAEFFGAAWAAVRATVATVGPQVLGIVQGVGRVTQQLGGAETIVVAVVAYKGLAIASRAAAAGQALFTAASAGAAQAALAEAVAADTATASLERKAAAELQSAAAAQRTLSLLTGIAAVMAVGAAASGNYATATILAGGALVGLALKARAAVNSLRAAGSAVTAVRVATLALGGPLGIAGIGVAALGVGFLALQRFSRNAAGGLRAVQDALEELNAAVEQGQQLREQVAATGEAASEARLTEQQARRRVEQLRAQQAASQAQPGSLAGLALADRLRAAEEQLTTAIQDRAQAERAVAQAQREQRQNEAGRAQVIADTTRRINEQVDALTKQDRFLRVGGVTVGIRPTRQELSPAEQLRRFLELTGELGESANFIDRVVGGTLNAIAAQLNAIPDQKTIDIVIELAGQGRTARGILDELAQLGIAGGARISQAEELRFANAKKLFDIAGQTDIILQEQERAARALVKTERDRLKVSRDRRDEAAKELEQLQEARRSSQEALRNAREALTAARQSLVDTQRAAAESITEAVNSAKQNLRSIADAVADALSRIGEAGGQALDPRLLARAQQLREAITRGEGGPETQRAAQQVAALAQAQQARAAREGDEEDRARRRLGDLADQFNRGQISVREFRRRLDNILRDFKFDSPAFAREFGTAARNDLLAQLSALRRQAVAIAAGPQRAGGGTAPDIVSPLEAVAQATSDIADARHEVREAIRNVHEAERRFREDSVAEAKAQTRLTRRNNLLTQRTNELVAAQNALLKVGRPGGGGNRPKPTGDAAEDARRNTTRARGG